MSLVYLKRASQKSCPNVCKMGIVKWYPLYLPLDGPDTEHSNVNELIIFNSFQIEIRAVDSFDD